MRRCEKPSYILKFSDTFTLMDRDSSERQLPLRSILHLVSIETTMCISSSNILLQGVLQPINLFISTTAYKTNPRKRIFELVFRTTQNSVSGLLQAENREADINTIFVSNSSSRAMTKYSFVCLLKVATNLPQIFGE